MSSNHTTASADWRTEYEHQDVEPPEANRACEADGCNREGGALDVVGGAVTDSRVLCPRHAKQYLGVST